MPKQTPPPTPALSALSLAEERALLERLHRGDKGAFRVLYDQFSMRLFRAVILPRVRLPDVAEDILRDTFLSAFEKICNVTWQDRSLYYWLSRIAYNKVIDFHRANRRSEKFVQGFAPYTELDQPPPQSPEASALADEHQRLTSALVHGLLDKLNPRYRQAVTLRFLDNKPREECASTMNVTVGNFDVILFRALQRMKALHDAGGEHDQPTNKKPSTKP
jgi:RNA polymerase sigma factor (sigma-70 family)